MVHIKNCVCFTFISLFTSLFVIVNKGNAQDQDYKNHAAYWYHRTRLRNDFLKIGKEDGESIPMEQRGLYMKLAADGKVRTFSNADWDGEKAKWGDAMAELGYYIAVLATEYKMLSDNNQNTDQTINELYHALYAVNRLDLNAEKIFTRFKAEILHNTWYWPYMDWLSSYNGPTYTPTLDGFMVRDDIEEDFVTKNLEHFNYDGNAGFCSKIKISDLYADENGVKASSYCSHAPANDPWRKHWGTFISQDNYYNVLVGLSLVRRFVPAGTTYKIRIGNEMVIQTFQDNESDIYTESYRIARRALDYFEKDDFELKYPDGGDMHRDNGGNPGFYQWPHQRTVKNMHGMTWTDYNYGLYNFSNKCEYDNWKASFGQTEPYWAHPINATNLASATSFLWLNFQMEKLSWDGYTKWKVATWHPVDFMRPDVQLMTGNFLAISNSFYSFYENETYLKLDLWDKREWKLPHQALLMNVLYGDKNCPFEQTSFQQDFLDAKNIVNSCKCENNDTKLTGSYCIPYQDGTSYAYPSTNFSTTSRLDHPQRVLPDAIGDPDVDIVPAEYNGLDYMLYHNLYYIVKSKQTTNLSNKIVDFSTRKINVAYPFNTGIYNWGTNTQPATVGAYEYIETSSTINSGAVVQMKAGKSIELKYNFKALPNSSFSAQIERLSCSNIFNPIPGNTNAISVAPIGAHEEIYELASLPTHYEEYTNSNESKIVDETNGIKKASGTSFQTNLPSLPNSVNSFIVYPNPSNGVFDIVVQDGRLIKNVAVTNVAGQTMKSISVGNQSLINLDLSDIPKGTYFLEVTFITDSKVFDKVIIK